MKLQLKNRNEGFTIIEVLIVLAIAGLIMLIVFLAVPALQRNQRNTSRKTDVGRVGSVTTEYVSNNNGSVPAASVAPANPAGTIQTAAGTLSQYTGNYLTIAAGAFTNNVNTTQMRIQTNAECGVGAAAANAVVATNSTRSMVILYAVENSSATPTRVCQPI